MNGRGGAKVKWKMREWQKWRTDRDLALAICFEIQRLFQRDHVASMNKKEVRHCIEQLVQL